MGCGCKGSNETTKNNQINEVDNNNSQGWVVKSLLFLFVIVLSPLILLLLLWIMYHSVINKKPVNDTLSFLMNRIEKLKTVKENQYEEDDEEEIDEENYEYEIVGLDKK